LGMAERRREWLVEGCVGMAGLVERVGGAGWGAGARGGSLEWQQGKSGLDGGGRWREEQWNRVEGRGTPERGSRRAERRGQARPTKMMDA